MPTLAAARQLNASLKPSYLPVAVFVGGTSGVGQGTLEAFARHTNGNAHIVIVGRNEDAAKQIFSSIPTGTSEGAKQDFVSCDVSLMANVRATIPKLPEKINFLVLSPGFLSLKGFTPTSEGIDRKLACHYYARFQFTQSLLPALLKSKEQGEDAKVMSILAPGTGGPVKFDDLGLKNNYSIKNASEQSVSYTDLAFEEFAKRNPSISFIHSFPGLVRTNGFGRGILGTVMRTALYPVSVSQDEMGEYLLSGFLSAKPGFTRLDSHGDDMGKKKYFDATEEERQVFWKHTLEATGNESEETA